MINQKRKIVKATVIWTKKIIDSMFLERLRMEIANQEVVQMRDDDESRTVKVKSAGGEQRKKWRWWRREQKQKRKMLERKRDQMVRQ
jgi:hypothetical protein